MSTDNNNLKDKSSKDPLARANL